MGTLHKRAGMCSRRKIGKTRASIRLLVAILISTSQLIWTPLSARYHPSGRWSEHETCRPGLGDCDTEQFHRRVGSQTRLRQLGLCPAQLRRRHQQAIAQSELTLEMPCSPDELVTVTTTMKLHTLRPRESSSSFRSSIACWAMARWAVLWICA